MDKLRVGLFKIEWDDLRNNTAGVADAMRNIVVIGAQQFSDGVGYAAISVDDTFDWHDMPDPSAILNSPVYELKLGINHDGTRTFRWKKLPQQP